MWELLFKLWEFLLANLWPPLVLEVERFYFQDVSARPNDIVVVCSSHPRRYYAKLSLTNRTGKPAYVKSIALRAWAGKVRKEAHLPNPLRLESNEFKKHDVVFPLGENEKPMTGEFNIEITPSVGRKSVKRVSL